jgi:amino acid adenylation domain-containing protein
VKSIKEFLSYLAKLDVKLQVEDDRLHCDAPKGVLTPTLRAELSEHKAEIIAFLRQVDSVARSQLELIRPISREGDLPLSFAQQRLWFLDQLEGPSATYNIPGALRLTGPLDGRALEQAFNEIVRRHETLRTTFATMDGKPIQVIAPTLTILLPVVDLQHLSEDEQAAAVKHLTIEQAQRPFDLATGPLIRATLLKIANRKPQTPASRFGASASNPEHILLFTMHHIVSDGWSFGVLTRELTALYAAFSADQPSPLPELAIQYADFAVWQREWLNGRILEDQLGYWKQQLTGAPTLLELPTDRPRPPVQTFRGSALHFEIDQDLTERLEALSLQAGASLFMTLYAAFAVLLSRYSGQEDIVIGSPIANRNRRELEPLIGFFVNTLALRADLSGNPTFRELLDRVRQVTLNAYAHQDLPFERLVDKLQPERNLSHSPLFQVTFVLQNAPLSPLELPGLSIAPVDLERATAKFDLNLSLRETAQGLAGTAEYNTDLFDRDTIARTVKHFQTLLVGIAATQESPDQKISNLPLLDEAEQRQLLVEWNNTQARYQKDKCIHELFEAQVEATPDAMAVVLEDQHLTYRELNQRANQLAHYLQGLGIGPGVLAGVYTERSLDMIVGLLGVLKAGGGYVPLDPDYPQERLAFILEDFAQASPGTVPVVLTQARLKLRVPQQIHSQLVCLDADWPNIARHSQENPVSDVTPDNLAYAIYTSGSTGQPKGVMIAHRGVCNLAEAQIEIFDIQSDSRVLQFASFSFDATVSEVFTALCSGATLFLGTTEALLPGTSLSRLLCEQAITCVTLPPSILAVMPAEELTALHTLVVAGEACPPHLAERWSGGRRFLNAYGPTEASVCATAFEYAGHSPRLPIGQPIANTQIYILDQHLQPVPIGRPGELHIAGVSLARGYLNRPKLTAEKFIPNPFSVEPGTRLYKSGDLARYLPDGNIEFLGRLDHQVKLRGFRIELGEIETSLTWHPAVQGAVVLLREDRPGRKQLVAYVVPAKGHQALHDDDASRVELWPSYEKLLARDDDGKKNYSGSLLSSVRHYLEEKLPDYMVPSAFVFLDELPMTPNGKVDRRALPAPDGTRPELEATFVMPQTETERALATIWQKVLEVDKVGIHDNFFDLGGHSLLIIKVHSKLQKVFERDLSIVEMFKYPTISALTEYLTQEPGDRPALQPSRDRANKQKEAIKRQRQRMRTISQR